MSVQDRARRAQILTPMTRLFTKRGRPLQRDGDKLYARSGKYLGRIKGRYVFDTSGKYAGTIDGDRVVYRSMDSARVAAPSVAAARIGLAAINAIPAAILGDEPPFAD